VLASTVTANWHLYNNKFKFRKIQSLGYTYHTKSTIKKPVQKPAMSNYMTVFIYLFIYNLINNGDSSNSVVSYGTVITCTVTNGINHCPVILE